MKKDEIKKMFIDYINKRKENPSTLVELMELLFEFNQDKKTIFSNLGLEGFYSLYEETAIALNIES